MPAIIVRVPGNRSPQFCSPGGSGKCPQRLATAPKQLPIVEVRWHFRYPRPHVWRLLLCAGHRARLAFRDQYLDERALEGVSVGGLYDAAVEDCRGD